MILVSGVGSAESADRNVDSARSLYEMGETWFC